MKPISEWIDEEILAAIELEKIIPENIICGPCDELLSLGELIDRLAIINIKLFNLKNLQAKSIDVGELAGTAKVDVGLCKERSRIKKAIDHKLISMIQNSGEGFNPEVKNYGV